MDPEQYEAHLSPELRVVKGRVCKAFEQAQPVHTAYEKFWRDAYTLHRNHKELQDFVSGSRSANDRDAARREFESAWGADLGIPLIFSTIETVVPRIVAQPPTLTVRPRREEAIPAVKPIKELLEQQQRNINYEHKLEPTVRRALKYGLGPQKTYWEKRVRMRRSTGRPTEGAAPTEQQLREEVVFEGPQVEPVEVFDFFWDPAATCVEDARWLIHRTWRDIDYIGRQIEQGRWFPQDGQPADETTRRALLEAIGKSSPSAEWGSAFWLNDLKPGQVSPMDSRAGREHEILEYHDGENVYTVIDKRFVAVADLFPYYHREKPFQIYRPTTQEGEFVGISEVEPIKHLQLELNALRSQRRDNARFVLDRVYAYTDGLLDPKMLKRGPGTAVPVAGDPQDALFPIPVEDLPASSYREEQEIKADVDRATGIDDSVAGAGAAGDTATGTQLVQQAAGVRIAHKARNLILDMARPTARQFLELDRQFLKTKVSIRIDDPTAPDGYRFAEVDPELLMAEVDIEPDAESTQPDNVVQKRNDGVAIYNLLRDNENVDQRHLIRWALTQHDVLDADSFLTEQTGQEPGDVLQSVAQAMQQGGVPEEQVLAILQSVAPQFANGSNSGGPPAGPPAEQPAGTPS